MVNNTAESNSGKSPELPATDTAVVAEQERIAEAERAAEAERNAVLLNPERPNEYVPAFLLDTPVAVRNAADTLARNHPIRQYVYRYVLGGLEAYPYRVAMALARRFFGARGFLPETEFKALEASGRITQEHLQAARAEASLRSTQPVSVSVPTTVETLAELLDRTHGLQMKDDINRQMIKWCAAYLEQGYTKWTMNKGDCLYDAWRRHVVDDLTLSLHDADGWQEYLETLPLDHEAALNKLLADIGVEPKDVESYLRSHLLHLPGWASHVKWRQLNGEEQMLTDYLIIRLFYELHLSLPFTVSVWGKSLPPYKLAQINCPARQEPEDREVEKLEIWQDALEIGYRNSLLDALRLNQQRQVEPRTEAPKCQIVLCMDVRSEPVRLELDNYARYETYGFAGFFGFPIRFRALGSAESLGLAPILFTPDRDVEEESDDSLATIRMTNMQGIFAASVATLKSIKSDIVASWGFIETFGFWSALPLIGQTFFPERYTEACDRAQRLVAKKPETYFNTSAFSIDEQVTLGATKLRAIGLWRDFAEVVVLCGHIGESANNHYLSALHCGACGGQPGGTSARFAARVFNDPQVRDGLRKVGIDIPASTVFVAAEHNTTTDAFEFFLAHTKLNESQSKIVDELRQDLNKIGGVVRQKRAPRLPQNAIGLNEPQQRAPDWAQPSAETGLARNAALIVGPRHLTSKLDLGSRVFLQSYDHSIDNDRSILELIMTAPLVVAQWINAEYNHSQIDKETLGSDSKVVHNVVGDFGVMRGASSDLLRGLPWQSTLDHEPLRLLCIIQATQDSMDWVLKKHDSVAGLVKNRWIHLVSLDPVSGKFSQCISPGVWIDLK